MLIDCTTKGCMGKTEAKLNVSTDEVLCEACGNPIQNVTVYTKKALKSMGQVSRNKVSQPFQALCNKCHVPRSLYVDKNDKAFCSVCNTQVLISKPFLMGLKDYLSKKDQDL